MKWISNSNCIVSLTLLQLNHTLVRISTVLNLSAFLTVKYRIVIIRHTRSSILRQQGHISNTQADCVTPLRSILLALQDTGCSYLIPTCF